MNHRVIAKPLGIVALMLSVSMLGSLPWGFPCLNGRSPLEGRAIAALLITAAIAAFIGIVLLSMGRKATDRLFRHEALAVVGVSWCLATLLGALPYTLSGTCKAPSLEHPADPGVPMTIVDALFESASGFTGTGATVITDLEDPALVPRAILFWRSETHFLGGLGIMVLFVALLGQGSVGKAIMRAEVPGVNQVASHARVQHAALAFTGIYVALNVILTALLLWEGMSVFDALCHSFGTISTGGFGTYNVSVAYFRSGVIEMTITLFMAISCINFALLYSVVLGRPKQLFCDVEVRVYLGILVTSTLAVILFGLGYGDFATVPAAMRYSLFQVTSILTNTGFVTHDFDQWNQFGRGLLFLLMFIGGCAGSTSCSIKVIRYIILWKLLARNLEMTYHPSRVSPIRIGPDAIDERVANHVLVYFGLILATCVVAWIGLILAEPDATWTRTGHSLQEKLIDCASGVGATINGVGPGLGTIGASRNYGHFQPASILILTLLMLLGRLEIIPILLLFMPRFWKRW